VWKGEEKRGEGRMSRLHYLMKMMYMLLVLFTLKRKRKGKRKDEAEKRNTSILSFLFFVCQF
jgi:hypothetical protein